MLCRILSIAYICVNQMSINTNNSTYIKLYSCSLLNAIEYSKENGVKRYPVLLKYY